MVVEFKDKDGYKPNVKVEYVDDNGRMMTPKEAFRYLSHRFHGKGSGKRKTEKRSKKVEMEQVWGSSQAGWHRYRGDDFVRVASLDEGGSCSGI